MAKKELVILDTNILIEIRRQNGAVIQKCDKLGITNLAISTISFCEFWLEAEIKRRYIVI